MAIMKAFIFKPAAVKSRDYDRSGRKVVPMGGIDKESLALQWAVKQLYRLNELDSLLDARDSMESRKLLRSLLECLREVRSKDDHSALEIYYSVSVAFLGFMNRKGLKECVAEHCDLRLLTRIDAHPTWSAAVDYLYELLQVLLSVEIDKSTDDCTIVKLKQYIGEHLNGDLSLATLAELVHFNPSYLSRLFKKETGMNVKDYILEVRVERASLLLMNRSMRIEEIAERIGYQSAHSFSRFFRSMVGVSPHMYRETCLPK